MRRSIASFSSGKQIVRPRVTDMTDARVATTMDRGPASCPQVTRPVFHDRCESEQVVAI
jgi:hypothetical protein